MALALYRKYRPCSFAELIGQDHVTEPLMQALRSGRLNHAYLFSGPRGCGKTSSARILARSLNCEQGPTPQPCGDCESCRALAPDGPGSIDVIEIDAASHGGVDDARELRERAFFAPAVSRYKIYIIDEAHMVSSAGFNALLKLVEEPPDYVKFVFATTEPEKVLGTIKSRTHHYPFRLIPPGVLRPYLEDLCAREGVAVEPGVVPLVVRAGGGSARDSLSVLDQLIAGAGADGVTYAGAVALLGVTDASLIDEACDALAAGDGAGAFVAIERVAEAGLDPRRFAGDLLERLRDLILLRQVPDAAGRGLIDAPADQLERMQAHAAHLGPATLSRWADIVHNGLVEMRGTASPRLLLELIVARMLLPAVDDSSASLLSRLEQLEQGRSAGRVFPGSPGPQEGSEAKPVPGGGREAARAAAAAAAQGGSGASGQARVATPSAASDTGDLDADGVATTLVARDSPEAGGGPMPVQSRDPGRRAAVGGDMPIPAAHEPGEGENMDAARVRRAWNEILSLLGRGNKRMAAMARDAVVREVEGRTLVLVFAHSFHLNSINNDHSALLTTVSQVLGGTWQLRCELGGDQKSAGVDKPKPSGSSTARATTADGADGWPAPAPIGGVGTARSQATPGPAQTAAAPKAAAGRQAARAAAKPSGTATTRSRGGAPRLAVPSDDGGPPEEPPYDPEFDGPPGVYDGFAPGDEPTEEIMDPVVARRDSQQQAVEVVKQMFAGAETIGEVDAR